MSSSNLPQWRKVDAIRNLDNKAKNLHPPQQTFRTKSGKVRRVPALPFMYFCKKSGNVQRIVMMNTRNLEKAYDPKRYMHMEINRQLRAGAFPWEYGDAVAYAPGVVSGRTREQWEAYREQEADRRRKAHDALAAEMHGKAFKSDTEKRLLESGEMLGQVVKSLTEALQGALESAQSAPAKKPRKSKAAKVDPEPASE